MKLFHKACTAVAIAATATLGVLGDWSATAKAANLTIGQNFTGITLSDVERLNGFRLDPPDTIGAVGTNHIVEFTNGAFAIYDKSTGTPLQKLSDTQFWTDIAGISIDSGLTDPRVVYDVASKRWFAVEIDVPTNDEGEVLSNNLLLAVSNSSDPSAGWKGFRIDPDSTDTLFADFPTFGLDADGVYIGSINFNVFAGAEAPPESVLAVSIPKADLLSTAPTVANATIFQNLDIFQYGISLQPPLDFGVSDNRAALLATDVNAASGSSSNQLKRANVFNSDSNLANISSPVDIGVDTYTIPPLATQPDGTTNIDTGLADFSGNVFEAGDSLWAVHSIDVNARAALRWYEIDERTNAVLQSGTIGDPDHDYFFPTIAVNQFGDVVIGFNRSGLDEFISSYAVLGETVNGVTTFGTPLLLKAGEANYHRFGGDFERWGDYSATVIDPSDPFSFWTFQEFAASPDAISDLWGTQITQVRVVRSVPEASAVIGLLPFAVLGAASMRKRKHQPQIG